MSSLSSNLDLAVISFRIQTCSQSIFFVLEPCFHIITLSIELFFLISKMGPCHFLSSLLGPGPKGSRLVGSFLTLTNIIF